MLQQLHPKTVTPASKVPDQVMVYYTVSQSRVSIFALLWKLLVPRYYPYGATTGTWYYEMKIGYYGSVWVTPTGTEC